LTHAGAVIVSQLALDIAREPRDFAE